MDVTREQPPARPVRAPPSPSGGPPAPPRHRTPRDRIVDFARRRRRWLIALGVLVVLYTVFGFLILPLILKRQLERRGTEALHRQVTIERVRTNPYALSVTIDGLAVKERDGGPFLSWERLYLKHKLWRVIRWELNLQQIQLVRFRARVALDKKGDLNFQDLLDQSSSDSSQEPPAKRSFVFAVDTLDIVQAEIDFSDRSRRKPFETQIGPFGIRLTQFRSVPDSTAPYSFSGSTESGETFSWGGTVRTEPLRSTGTITFDGLLLKKYRPYYAESVGFEIRDGKVGVKTGYQLEWGAEKRVMKIVDGSVSVRTLILGLPGAPTPKVELPSIDIGGIGVDVPGRVVRVETVSLQQGIVRAARGKDGALDIEAMGPPKSSAPAKPAPPAKAISKDEEWQWSLGKIELAGWKVELQDEVPKRPVHLVLAPLDLRLEKVASQKSQTSQLSLSTVWNGSGKIAVAGPVQLLQPGGTLTVKVEALDLRPLDPYLDTYADLAARLGEGRFRLEGKAHFDAGVQPIRWGFEADTGIGQLILLDADQGQEVARWRDLQVSGINAGSQPMAVQIRSIRCLEPKVGLAIAEDGSSNLDRLLKTPPSKDGDKAKKKKASDEAAAQEEAAATSSGTPAAPGPGAPQTAATGGSAQPDTATGPAPPASATATATDTPAASGTGSPQTEAMDSGAQPATATASAPGKPVGGKEPPVAVSIGSFQVVRGGATLADRSVAPPVTVSMTDLDVRIRSLSNARNARSQVALKALAAGGPLEINGVLSPRMINDATDVKVSSRGVDLIPLSPYFGRYAGYVLDKGTLDLDLEYKVARRTLTATNLIKTHQLTFGEATHSPDATKLPIKVALAVLQDGDGLAELDVPVTGNIDDPNFHFGKVVGKAFSDVIIKVATSPFALLGKVFGGGGKLDLIDFAPGTATLTPSAEKTLQGLTKALESRPALRMDIEGTADPAADGKTLRVQELRRQAQQAKGKGGELTDEEYLKYVKDQYGKARPALPPGAGPAQATVDSAAMEEAVLGGVQLPPETLRALAQERTNATKARLVTLGIDAGRLSPAQGGERAKKVGGARAYFTLK